MGLGLFRDGSGGPRFLMVIGQALLKSMIYEWDRGYVVPVHSKPDLEAGRTEWRS